MACKYIINGKSYTEQELKEYLLSGGLDELVKDNTLDLSKIKPTEYAVQEPSTGRVLQPTQEGVGEAGGERQRVEQGVEGQKITEEGRPKGDEEKVNDFEVIEDKLNTLLPLLKRAKAETMEYYKYSPDFQIKYSTDVTIDYLDDLITLFKDKK